MGFLKKLSFKNISKSISKNISKIRTKKVKNVTAATSSTELDNEASDSDENVSLYTQEDESFTSLDATSIEDEVFSETFEFTINSNISATDSPKHRSLSRPTLAKIEEEFNFEINKNPKKFKIEITNNEESTTKDKKIESKDTPLENVNEYPRSSKTNNESNQDNIKRKKQEKSSAQKNSFSNDSDDSKTDDEEKTDEKIKQNFLEINKEIIENNESHYINNENKETGSISKEEPKVKNELENIEKLDPNLTKKQLKKYQKKRAKESDQIYDEPAKNDKFESRLKIDENETITNATKISNEIIVPELVEEKKQMELVQESQQNSIYNDKKAEEFNKYMTTGKPGKKPMNKKQLKKLKKFQSQNDISDEEISKTSAFETKCQENEKETEACKNSLLDDTDQAKKNSTKLEDSNGKKDSDKEFEITREQKEKTDANENVFLIVEPLKKEKKLSKKQRKRINKQNENFEVTTNENLDIKQEYEEKISSPNREELETFEPKDDIKHEKIETSKKKSKQIDFSEKKDNEETVLDKSLASNSNDMSEINKSNLSLEKDEKVLEKNLENNLAKGQINKEPEDMENHEYPKEEIQYQEIRAKNRKKMSKNQMKKSRKAKSNKSSEDETEKTTTFQNEINELLPSDKIIFKATSHSQLDETEDWPTLASNPVDKIKDRINKNESWMNTENLDNREIVILEKNESETKSNNDIFANEKPLTKKQLRKLKQVQNKLKPKEEAQKEDMIEIEKSSDEKKEVAKKEDSIEIEKSADDNKINFFLDEIKDSKTEEPIKRGKRSKKLQSKRTKHLNEALANEILKNESSFLKEEITENVSENNLPLKVNQPQENKNNQDHQNKSSLNRTYSDDKDLNMKFETEQDKEKGTDKLETTKNPQPNKTFKSRIPVIQKIKKTNSNLTLSNFTEQNFSESVQNLEKPLDLDQHNNSELKIDKLRCSNLYKLDEESNIFLNDRSKLCNSKDVINEMRENLSKNDNLKTKSQMCLDKKPSSYIFLDSNAKKEKKFMNESIPKYKDKQNSNMTKSSDDCKRIIMDLNKDQIKSKSNDENKTRSHSLDYKDNLFERSRAYFKEMEEKLAEEKKNESLSRNRLNKRSSSIKNELNPPFYENGSKFLENKLANKIFSSDKLTSSISKNKLNDSFDENSLKQNESFDKNETCNMEEKFDAYNKNKLSFTPSIRTSEIIRSFNENNPNIINNSEGFKITITAQNIDQNVHFNPDLFKSSSDLCKYKNTSEIHTDGLELNKIKIKKDNEISNKVFKINHSNCLNKPENFKEITLKPSDKERKANIDETQIKKSQKITFTTSNSTNEQEKNETEQLQKETPEKKSFSDLVNLFSNTEKKQDQNIKPNLMFKRHSSYMGEKIFNNQIEKDNLKNDEFSSHAKRKPLLENFYQQLLTNNKPIKEKEDSFYKPVRRAVSLSEEISKANVIETPISAVSDKENSKIVKLEKKIKEKLKNIMTTSSEEEIKNEECVSSNISKIKQQIGKKLEANLKQDLTRIKSTPVDSKTKKSANVELLKKSYEVDRSLVGSNETEINNLDTKKNSNIKINLMLNTKPLDSNDKSTNSIFNQASCSSSPFLASSISKEINLKELKETFQPLQEFNIETATNEIPHVASDIIYSTKKFQKNDDSHIKDYFETLTRDYNQKLDKYFDEKQTNETTQDEESTRDNKTLAYFLKFDEPQAFKKKNEQSIKDKKKSNDIFENYMKFDGKSSELLKPTNLKKKISKKKVKFNLDVINHEPPTLDTDESIEELDQSNLKDLKNTAKNSNPFRNKQLPLSFPSNELGRNYSKNEYLINRISQGSNVSEFNFYETNQIKPGEFQSYSNERKPIQIIKKEGKNNEPISLLEKRSPISSNLNNRLITNPVPNLYNEFNRPSLYSVEKKTIPIIFKTNEKPHIPLSSSLNTSDDNSKDFYQPSTSLNENKKQIPISLKEKKSSSFSNTFDTRNFSIILNELNEPPLSTNDNRYSNISSDITFENKHSPMYQKQSNHSIHEQQRHHVPIAGKIFSEFKSKSSLSSENQTYADVPNFNENILPKRNFQNELENNQHEYIVLDPPSDNKSNDIKQNNKGTSVYYQIIGLLDSYDQKTKSNKKLDPNNNFTRATTSDENTSMSYVIDKNGNSILVPNKLTHLLEEDKQFYQKVINPKPKQNEAENEVKNTPTLSSSESVYSQISNLLDDYFKSNEFSLSSYKQSIEDNFSNNQQANNPNKKSNLATTPTSSISSNRSVYSEISDLLELYLVQDDIPVLHERNKFTDDVDDFNK